jgi:hypothetical protein
MNKIPRILAPVFLTMTVCVPQTAGELDVRIRVDLQNLPPAHREMLENDFSDKISDYMSRRWTNLDFGNEQIPVEFRISFRDATPDYRYTAQLFVGSSRPIYNMDGRNSIILRLLDDNWEFTLPPGKPLLYDEYSYDGLTTMLDYYAFLVIGMDFDTYEPLAGTPFLERAANIARVAQRSGGKGWDRDPTGFSRLSFVEDLLASRNQKFREALFHYHYNGLDLLSVDQTRGLESIVEVVETFAEMRVSDPRNLPIRLFFETKYTEISEVLLNYPDRTVYDRLSSIDPSNRSTYDEYRRK